MSTTTLADAESCQPLVHQRLGGPGSAVAYHQLVNDERDCIYVTQRLMPTPSGGAEAAVLS